MDIRTALLALCALWSTVDAAAQTVLPSADPRMYVTTSELNGEEDTSYDGNAPMTARFEANAQDVGLYTPLYEWRFTREGDEQPFLTRYDADTEYTFTKSGTFRVELYVSFVAGTDTVQYEMDEPFVISLAESFLDVPNAFTPNGDGINDVFKVKDGYRSIVSFRAMVFNRWGKKLYEWNDPAGGWDGTSGGRDVPDGAYYLNLQARGADGRHYNIKKTINLLRGYDETGNSAFD